MQDTQIDALRMWHRRQLRATARSRRLLIIAALLVLAIIACAFILLLLGDLALLQQQSRGSTAIDVSLIRYVISSTRPTLYLLSYLPPVFTVLLIISLQSALRLPDELKLAVSHTAQYAAEVQTSRLQTWKWTGIISLTFTSSMLAYHIARNLIFQAFGHGQSWQLFTPPIALPFLAWIGFYCFSAELATLLFVRSSLNSLQRAAILLGIYVLAHV